MSHIKLLKKKEQSYPQLTFMALSFRRMISVVFSGIHNKLMKENVSNIINGYNQNTAGKKT